MNTPSVVKSASRTLDVFEAFAEARGVLPLAELARSLGIPRSSCLALLRTLVSRGYLYQSGTGGYYPTRKLSTVAEIIARYDPLIDRVLPVMAELRDRTQETVIFGKRQDDQVIYLAVAESEQTLRYSARPGDFKPLHGSASGKVLLAAIPEEERKKFLENLELTPITPRTITGTRELEADLRYGSALGWHYVESENVPDVIAIAAPVNLSGEIHALVVAGPLPRMKESVDRHVLALIEAVRCMESGGKMARPGKSEPD